MCNGLTADSAHRLPQPMQLEGVIILVGIVCHCHHLCTAFLVTWWMPVTSYVVIYVYTYPIYACKIFCTYCMSDVAGIFVSDIYKAIEFEVDVVFGCVFGTNVHHY